MVADCYLVATIIRVAQLPFSAVSEQEIEEKSVWPPVKFFFLDSNQIVPLLSLPTSNLRKALNDSYPL
jgi:hypothetical protein